MTAVRRAPLCQKIARSVFLSRWATLKLVAKRASIKATRQTEGMDGSVSHNSAGELRNVSTAAVRSPNAKANNEPFQARTQ